MKFSSLQPIILASSSPRRKEILEMVGLQFTVEPSKISEEIEFKGRYFSRYAKELAELKARAVANSFPENVIIGADTIVVFDGKVYPKPLDVGQARLFLKTLAGQTHSVFTGVCVYHSNKFKAFSVETKVTFRPFDDTLIEAYIYSGDPMDKAGAYGVQTAGSLLVKEIQGDFFNVMGLPVSKLIDFLRQDGLIELEGGGPAIDH